MATCPKCGRKTDEKTCPDCKTRLKPQIPISLIFIVLILIIILIACTFISPYKDVDVHDVVNPPIGEKVQFDGKYLGITTWGSDEDTLYYMPPTNYDIIQYGGQHIFLSEDYSSHKLIGNEGRMVHLEGEFEDGIAVTQPFENSIIDGYFFNADKIELI